MYHCVELEDEALLAQVVTKDDCLRLGGTWENLGPNFGNVAASYYTLLLVSTTEGWMDIMYAGIDARGKGLQPRKNHSVHMVVFFLGFMIVGFFFLLNLFNDLRLFYYWFRLVMGSMFSFTFLRVMRVRLFRLLFRLCIIFIWIAFFFTYNN